MTLIFTPSSITRFGTRQGYAYSEAVDLSKTPYAELPATLITWLTTQLASGESVSQVVLEAAGQITPEDGSTRPVINAAVSVTAPLGQRTFAVSSESLPSDLCDSLLAAWQSLS
jgi:hypothetical protein